MCSQNKTVEYRKKFVFVSWPKFITPALCSQKMSSSVHCSTAARNCGNINSDKKVEEESFFPQVSEFLMNIPVAGITRPKTCVKTNWSLQIQDVQAISPIRPLGIVSCSVFWGT